jgi:hypothetical protein
MLAAESVCRVMVLEPTHTSDATLDSPVILLQTVIIGHILDDATGGLGETIRRLYLRATGTGALGAREVGERPRSEGGRAT